MEAKLGDYQRRRDFATTPEPGGKQEGHRAGDGQLFVVHKHDASSLHYDLRLEVDGVLKSWAVPKGPSVNPRDKRLAVPTEDHPLEYADFEGAIPEGEYGAGTVLVWDTGNFQHLTEQQLSAADALDKGRINVWLEGQKLWGGYTLTRMSAQQDGQWLLIKMQDKGADRRRKPTKTQPRSVLTGSDLRAVAAREQEPG